MNNPDFMTPYAGVLAKHPCPCGSHPPDDVNANCERCKMVWTIAATVQLRESQRQYFETRRGNFLDQSRKEEKRLDSALRKLTGGPEQKPLFEGGAA